MKLYDDLLRGRPNLWSIWGWDHADGLRQSSETQAMLLAELPNATVIVADNVAEYLYAECSQEIWNVRSDFPILAPPMETMWIECRRPSRLLSGSKVYPATGLPRRWGALFKSDEPADELQAAIDNGELLKGAHQELALYWQRYGPQVEREVKASHAAEQTGQPPPLPSPQARALGQLVRWIESLERGEHQDLSRLRWRMEASLWLEYGPSDVLPAGLQWTRVVWTYAVDHAGALIDDPVRRIANIAPDGEANTHEVLQFLDTLMFSFLLSISFMHCKNVELTERPGEYVSRQARRAAERRGDPAPAKFYTLTIDPMRKVLRTEGQSETVGLKKALHICRGHFATYSNERPLFGKYAGTFWVPAHVRGSSDAGLVGKDYAVKPGQIAP